MVCPSAFVLQVPAMPPQCTGSAGAAITRFRAVFTVCVGQSGHERGATIGLTDGLLCQMRHRDQNIHDMRKQVFFRCEVEGFDVADRGDRHATGLQRPVKVRVRNWHDFALAASGLGADRIYTQQQQGLPGRMLSELPMFHWHPGSS